MDIGDTVEVMAENHPFVTIGVIDSIFNSQGWWLIEVIQSNAPHLQPGMKVSVCESDIVMGVFR